MLLKLALKNTPFRKAVNISRKKCICTMCCQNIVEKDIKYIVNAVSLQRWQRSNLISMFLLRQKTISKASRKSRRKILHPSWSMQILWVRLFVWMCAPCSCVYIGGSCIIIQSCDRWCDGSWANQCLAFHNSSFWL